MASSPEGTPDVVMGQMSLTEATPCEAVAIRFRRIGFIAGRSSRENQPTSTDSSSAAYGSPLRYRQRNVWSRY
jgi:hypothetical protein